VRDQRLAVSERLRLRRRRREHPPVDVFVPLLAVGRLDGFVAKVSGTELLLAETREPRFGDP